MRQAVSVITMLAAVMHLTLGCCLHPAHAAGAAACCGGDRPAAPACCCDDHDACGMAADRHEAGAEAAAAPTDGAICTAGTHACPGCDCVATTEAAAFPHLVACVAWIGDAFERPTGGMSGAARAALRAERRGMPSEPRPALFERHLA